MNKLYLIAIGALLSGIITVQAQEWKPQQWPATCKAHNECSVSFSGVKCKLRCQADICPVALGCALRRNTCPVFYNQQSSGRQIEQDRAG